MATWPATLPAPILNSIRESLADNVLRTPMDKGAAKLRRRTTASPDSLAFSLVMTPTQASTLTEFYKVTTVGGVDEFDFTHPRTSEAVKARFLQPPSLSDINGVGYRTEVQLEIMP